MKLTKKLLSLLCATSLCFAMSCGDDESSEPSLPQAIITELTTSTIAPGETITIDGSTSTNSEGGVFIWEIQGSGAIIYSGEERALPTTISDVDLLSIAFSASINGSYSVNLRIEKNGQFSNAGVSFQVEGGIILTAIPDGFEFVDLNTEPDYILSGDIEISNATLGSGLVTLAIESDASVTVKGQLTIVGAANIQGVQGAAWKGLKISESGSLQGNGQLTIIDAGSEGIDSYPSAALVVENSTFQYPGIIFQNTTGYDLYLTENVTNISGGNIAYSSKLPVYAPARLWTSIQPPYNVVDDLITLVGDVNTQLSLSQSSILLYSDVLIKGGIFLSQQIVIQQESGVQHTIFMEENTAFIAGGGISAFDINFDGENSASWQGIYIGQSSGSRLTGTTISNAGGAPISSSSIVGIVEQTAVYVNGLLGSFQNNTITNSGGYGIYSAGFGSLASSTSNYGGNEFTNNELESISVPQEFGAYFSSGNTFITPDDVAAIEVRQSSTKPNQTIEWNGLGDNNFYHFKGFFNLTAANITINEGVHFKFADNKGIDFSGNGTFKAVGTLEKPIIFEGSSASASSWYGIKIGNNDNAKAIFEYVTIDGGGKAMFTGASEEANLVIDSGGDQSFVNCTFSNSDGYGTLIELDATQFDFESAVNNNTYTNNISGNVLDRNL